MISRSVLLAFLIAIVAMSPGSPEVPAREPGQKAKLTSAEETAVAAYLQILRDCCMRDGGINMVNHGVAESSPVWVAPYFADHVALALVVGHHYKKSPDDMARVSRWIEWRLKRQDKGGFWFDYTGTAAAYKSNNKVDAHDSSAALFILLLERYQREGGDVTNGMTNAAKACLQCIMNVTDHDGLTWAKPDYKVKYLMDNVEVYAGLKAGEAFFAKAQDTTTSKDCGNRASAIGKVLPAYFAAKERDRFAWALHPNGSYNGGFEKVYPHGLAQLYGVSFVKAEVVTLGDTLKRFAPETGPTATGTERFLVAASRVGGQTARDWRERVVKDESLRDAKLTYNYRPALAVLALLEGADWMPSLVN